MQQVPLFMIAFGLGTSIALGQPVPLSPQQAAQLVTTPSGLKYVDLRVGKGAMAEKGRQVRVLYTGWLSDGKEFDSRKDRAKPFAFDLGQGAVIKGWDEGVIGMRIGGKRRLVVPGKLAYGPQGYPRAKIPPNAELTFDVELVGVSRGPRTQ
ncbi:MAG: FKBP-type peptidyl-prolyl cis-trans isomerase [Acidimicrobiia bacterium]